MENCKKKIGYVALAGSVVLGLGFAAAPGGGGKAGKASSGTWYGSIEPIAGKTTAKDPSAASEPVTRDTAIAVKSKSVSDPLSTAMPFEHSTSTQRQRKPKQALLAE